MTHLLFYYLAGLALLFLALPLSLVFFPDRPDRGWAGARILGLVLTALLHRLAGPVQLEPWSLPALLLGLPVLVAWYTWVRRSHWKIRAWLVESRNSILGIELVFLCTFFIAALLSAYDPAVFGTERLMDMAVLQSISVAAAFPPLDPWFSGEALNYYWFGHHMALLPGALAGVPTSITYNLALAYIFAAVVQLSCGLLLPPAGSLQRALLGGAMVGFAGNLHAFVQLFTATSDTNLHFAASRIIPGTITEFPLLSLLVGDLHAHFALLPVILLFLLWLQVSPCDKRSMLAPIIVVNLLFFATAMGNPWNLAALLGLFGSLKILRCTVLPWWTLAPALALLPLVWPGRGLGITLAWVHPAQASPVPEFLQLWVVPLLLVTGLVDWTTVGTKLRKHRMLWIAAPLVLSFQSPVAGLCLALALLLWLAHRQGESLWAGMGIAALMLLIAPELVYLEDAYPAPFERMNTVFKFSYAAWPLLMLAAARAALLLLDTGPEGLQPLRRASLLLAIGVLFIYGARAVPLRLGVKLTTPLWDGIEALQQSHPEDIALIRWLAPRLQPNDTCLEAPGISYQWSGRISALTGCATVLGWEGHEQLWRNGSSEVSKRREDARKLFETSDPLVQQRLLERYGIDWVIVSEVELDRFGRQPPPFEHQLFEPVYTYGPAKIYRISKP